MTRMYDRPTLGPDGWIVDETPTPALLTWSLDASGNPVGLVGPDGEVIMEFVDVGSATESVTVEV